MNIAVRLNDEDWKGAWARIHEYTRMQGPTLAARNSAPRTELLFAFYPFYISFKSDFYFKKFNKQESPEYHYMHFSWLWWAILSADCTLIRIVFRYLKILLLNLENTIILYLYLYIYIYIYTYIYIYIIVLYKLYMYIRSYKKLYIVHV